MPAPRDPERIDRIIEKLRSLWKLYPDQRLGQIMANLGTDYVTEDWETERAIVAVTESGWGAQKH